MSVFLEWSSGVETGKERVASEDPEKPSTLLLARKQESVLSAFFGQLLQPGAAVVYFQLHPTYSLGPVAPNHQCRYQP
uniref:Uncharacterized protein n=1 Tax=Magallana gigas TaxID=29159 RepID=K1Q198_MAGGI